MTERRILELAQQGAIMLWDRAITRLKEKPDNWVRQKIERMRWNELNEIENLLLQGYNTKEQ